MNNEVGPSSSGIRANWQQRLSVNSGIQSARYGLSPALFFLVLHAEPGLATLVTKISLLSLLRSPSCYSFQSRLLQIKPGMFWRLGHFSVPTVAKNSPLESLAPVLTPEKRQSQRKVRPAPQLPSQGVQHLPEARRSFSGTKMFTAFPPCSCSALKHFLYLYCPQQKSQIALDPLDQPTCITQQQETETTLAKLSRKECHTGNSMLVNSSEGLEEQAAPAGMTPKTNLGPALRSKHLPLTPSER